MNPAHAQWLNDYAPQILDAVVDAILTIDCEGNIQSVNLATLKLFGYRENELIGEQLVVVLPRQLTGEVAFDAEVGPAVELRADMVAGGAGERRVPDDRGARRRR